MGGKMSCVLPGLYVGNMRNIKSMEELDEFNITHVISIVDSMHPIMKKEGVTYLRIWAKEDIRQNIKQYFNQTNLFIHSARTDGKHCLIHSIVGISRAVTIALAYIMAVTDLPTVEALNGLRGLSTSACPNYRFLYQLYEYHREEKVIADRLQLRRKFGEEFIRQPADIEFVQTFGKANFSEMLAAGHFRSDDSYQAELVAGLIAFMRK